MTLPGSNDVAVLDAAGTTPYTVTCATYQTVSGIQLASNATLAIDGGYGIDFQITNGTGDGINAGVISVSDDAAMTFQGTLDNVGAIIMDGATLRSGSPEEVGVTLTGGGRVTFDASAGVYSFFSSGDTVTNINNTISGELDLSLYGLINGNSGVIDASAKPAHYSQSLYGRTIDNGGLIECTYSKLGVTSQMIDNVGGTILATNGVILNLLRGDGAGGTLVGGTLDTTGTGIITDADMALVGLGGTLHNLGSLVVPTLSTVALEGPIDNTGAISMTATYGQSLLGAGVDNAVLTGGGTVILTNDEHNIFGATAAGATLTNVDNTVSGAGAIGVDDSFGNAFVLVNEAAGVIDADDSNSLTLDTGGMTATNAGLIEATGAGGLVIDDTPIDNAGGTILAAAGSRVLLEGVTIAGGVLKSAGTGLFKTIGGTNLLDGTTAAVTNEATLAVAADDSLTVEGAIDNTGQVDVRSAGDATTLTIGAAGATLSGSGQLSLSNWSENEITGESSAAFLTNVSNTITGAGQLGGGELTLINEAKGVIEGQFTTGLVIDTGANTITNAGLIEAVDGGSVSIESAIDNSGTLIVTKGTLGLQGAVDNTGQIDVRGGTAGTLSIAASGVTLTGGGDLALSNAGNQVTGATSAAVLTNVANTISGAGTITAILDNQAGGVVEGQFATGLVINSGSSTIANAGLIEAIDGGSVSVESALENTGTVRVTNGTLTLAGAVTGAGVAQIKGGVLDAAGAFDENVAFTGGTGELRLADSQGYTSGQISGFSKTGGTSLDLKDITFTSGSTKATFSGTSTSGLLTVTNGTQTATINLTGDYLASTFTTSSDGHGGTSVVDPTGPAAAVARFVETAARMAPATVAIATPTGEARDAVAPMLAKPGVPPT